MQSRTELNSHACSVEELGLAGHDRSNFFKVNEAQKVYIQEFKHLYSCLDVTDFEIWGTTNSPIGQSIVIDIVKCTGHDYCKSDTQIKDHFARKTVYMLTNQIRFDFQRYGHDSIHKESAVKMIDFGTWQSRKIY